MKEIIKVENLNLFYKDKQALVNINMKFYQIKSRHLLVLQGVASPLYFVVLIV